MGRKYPAILIATTDTPQTQLFADYLSAHLNCPANAIRPNSSPSDIEVGNALVLLDADQVDIHRIHQWHEKATEYSMTLAAFNLKCEDHAADLLSAFHLMGVFYRQDNLVQFCKGASALLGGHSWLPRSLMTRLICSYRSQQLNTYHASSSLTHRELEVISLLDSGDSNIGIASKLFVSEHTVRAHLYNIFRKLKVYNRFQAMHWARQNLYASSPLPTRLHQAIEP